MPSFALCRSCDRGQRYCSDPCRKRMRRRQVLAAGHRYQASEAGKEAHRHRQCTYRQRRSQSAVTHQSPVSIAISSPTPPAWFPLLYDASGILRDSVPAHVLECNGSSECSCSAGDVEPAPSNTQKRAIAGGRRDRGGARAGSEGLGVVGASGVEPLTFWV